MSTVIVLPRTHGYLALTKSGTMLSGGDTLFTSQVALDALCDHIQEAYHAPIARSCEAIETYFHTHTELPGFSESVSELLPLLFSRLQDECKHLMLKESGIVFPCIRQKALLGETCTVPPAVFEAIKETHQTLINLLQKLRQLLHNYVTQPGWPAEWVGCMQEFFALETSFHRWIYIAQSQLYPRIIKPL